MDGLPLRVRKVRIVGNKRTRPYVVEDQLQVCYVLSFCRPVPFSHVVLSPLGDAVGVLAIVQYGSVSGYLYTGCCYCCVTAAAAADAAAAAAAEPSCIVKCLIGCGYLENIRFGKGSGRVQVGTTASCRRRAQQ